MKDTKLIGRHWFLIDGMINTESITKFLKDINE